MKHGKLITFEGIEGCGKSTQIQKASEWLTGQGIPHIVTREPGGTAIGEQIRRILLSEGTAALDPVSEAMLYMADRFQHITEVIRPHLNEQTLVLCDRYHDSTVAYQGYARGISLELLDRLWNESGIAVIPDKTLLFDVDPETGIERSLRKLRKSKLDESRFEKETLDFHRKVRHGFLELARLDPERYRIVDALRSIDEIRNEVVKILDEILRHVV